MIIRKLSIHDAELVTITRQSSRNVDEPGEETTLWTNVTVSDGKQEFELTLFGSPMVSLGAGFTDWTDTEKATDRARNAERACEELREELRAADDHAKFQEGVIADLNAEAAGGEV